jgi:hypothetical protein
MLKTCKICGETKEATQGIWVMRHGKPNGLTCVNCRNAKCRGTARAPGYLAYRKKYMSQRIIDPITGKETTRKAAASRKKAANNPRKKLRDKMRNLLRNSIGTDSRATAERLGCSMPEFEAWIASQFQDGMTWENQGEWHFDHRIPCAVAKSPEEERALQHWSNFQPMWAAENIIKGSTPPNGWALELRLLMTLACC